MYKRLLQHYVPQHMVADPDGRVEGAIAPPLDTLRNIILISTTTMMVNGRRVRIYKREN